jgi:hypothetical protein
MTHRTPKRIVVDASIARAASERAAAEAVACRNVLDTILAYPHWLAFTDAIQSEWRRHQSRYAETWFRMMVNARLVVRVNAVRDIRRYGVLIAHLEKSGQTAKADALEKDYHLIDAARARDRLVLTGDDKLRKMLIELRERLGPVGKVILANPAEPAEEVDAWLRRGAPNESKRRLRPPRR